VKLLLVTAVEFVLLAGQLVAGEGHVGAVENPSRLPAASSLRQIGMPPVKRDTLLNGLQLILLGGSSSGRTSVHLRINNGAMFDLAGKGGLADLTAAMLLRGGRGLSAKNVSDMAEQLELKLGVETGWDSTDFVISGSSASLDAILDLLGRLIVAPAFDQKDLAEMKGTRVAMLRNRSRASQDAVKDKALEGLFGKYPFGHPIGGTVESINKITQDDLIYYHKRFYLPNNSELIVEGDATAGEVTQSARARLGSWKKGEKVAATFLPPEPLISRQVYLIDKSEQPAIDRPGVQPAIVAAVQMGISRRANDYYAALVMTRLVGILSQNAARTAGKAVTINASIEPRYLPGPIVVQIGCPSDQTAEAIGYVISAMNDLKSRPIQALDFERARADVVSEIQNHLESPQGAAIALLEIEQYGLGRDYLIHCLDWARAVSLGDMTRVSQKYLKPESLAIAVAAPAGQVEGALRPLGAITIVK
jgi:zinc protease